MGEKFFAVQQQMHRDNNDLQDYLRDLKNWSSDISKKDEALKSDKVTEDKSLPPVRNQHQKKPNKKKKKPPNSKQQSEAKKPQNGTPPGKSRIKAYDYRTWDKFDVEKACAELDSDEDLPADVNKDEDERIETDSEEERELEMQRRIQQASMEKDKGNALFKKGNYDDAVICYTAGMEADPTNAILPANRAMARLKQKRYEDAEKDCDKSISIDCTYVKAYARRAAARFELGRLEEATKDYWQVLNLEPSNKQAATEIYKITRIVKEREDTERQKLDGVYNIIQAVDKPVHLRSKKPLRRMVIEEIGTLTRDEEETKATLDIPQDPADIHRVVTPTQNKGEPGTLSKEVRAPVHRSEFPPSTPTPPTDTIPNVPGTPSSSYQLQADWKSLERFPEQLYQYFKKISPESYKKLFQQSLDSTLLMKILNLLQDQFIKQGERVYEILENLSQVKRFEMNIMFMSSKDKQVVQELFSYMQSSEAERASELDKLGKKYGL
ncbi:RNA polymerase II-associated protein 3-like [Asterias amurensis]|uniref:RNA polymerase II-associated protein 3-like n=1 Tax=Asterias amurensis TaxID=7602 RepID=UPI003AB30269